MDVVNVEKALKTLYGPIFENIEGEEKNITRQEKPRPQTRMDEAEEYILTALKNGERLVRDVEDGAKALWISGQTLARAKKRLLDKGVISYRHISRGQRKGVDWYMRLN